MRNRNFFSVIIPTYNRAPLILKTIDTVLNQSYEDFELLIIDDGSTDNTEEIIGQRHSKKIKYFKINNSERAAARNFGVLNSQGNYVTFLDSDDILYTHYLRNANESLTHFKHPPFFHLAYEIRNEKGKLIYNINNLISDEIKFITKGNPLSCLGVFIRRDIAVEFKFNEDRALSGSEDWELWLRIIANFGIKTDSRVSACLINHLDRSVLNFEEDTLSKRKELALKYAFEDSMVKKQFKKDYKKIDAYADGYISLHLALARRNSQSINYLMKSVLNYPLIILSRRFIATLKYLILNLLRK